MLDFIRPCGVVFLLSLFASWTCVIGSVIVVVCSLCVFLCRCRFVLCVLCMTVLMNCLLNAFANCVGEVTVFSLNVIVLFLGWFDFWWPIRVWSSKECVCVVIVIPVCV